MLTVYKEQELKGFKLNNPSSYPGVYLEPTKRLIELVEQSVESFVRPIGFHIRFRLSPGRTISELTDWLAKAYSRPRPKKGRKKENTFRPLYLWTYENDPNHKDNDPDGFRFQSGFHHHMALILDGHKATERSVHTLKTELLKAGLVLSLKVVAVEDDGETYDEPKAYSMDLSQEDGREAYVYWLSYICKVRTKEGFFGTRQRVWDGSRLPKQATPSLDGLVLPKNHQNEVGLILP